MAPKKRLPSFIAPMLAKSAEPFDSQEHLFEIKWDGTRALAFLEGGSYRIKNRRGTEISERYPEFSFLRGSGKGTILDGEIVVLDEGKPDFGLLQSREHTGSALRQRAAARMRPATYVVFDQLYEDYRPIMGQPLEARRESLAETVKLCSEPRLVLSEGVVGGGEAFFAEASRQRLEGVMAKRLGSPYLPGKRSDAWVKIKRKARLHCAIIGFVPSGRKDFKSLILATEEDGELRPVGKVGSGFDGRLREKLNTLLWARLRESPLVACRIRGRWVEPGLYCTVSYLERTQRGDLRAPVFEKLLVE